MTTKINPQFDKELELMKQNDIHSDPELEIIKIQETFSSVVKKHGPDNFSPMMIIFNSQDEPVFVCEPRPYTSKTDMYVAMAEMLFSHSAFSAKCFIMVHDTNMTMIDEKDSSITTKMEALNIAFVASEYACIAVLPYEVIKDNDNSHSVTWLNDQFSISSLSDNNHHGSMTELYFVMSHMKSSLFNMNTLVNYYNFRDFPNTIPEESIAQRVEVHAKF
jgi:hypothetical protein